MKTNSKKFLDLNLLYGAASIMISAILVTLYALISMLRADLYHNIFYDHQLTINLIQKMGKDCVLYIIRNMYIIWFVLTSVIIYAIYLIDTSNTEKRIRDLKEKHPEEADFYEEKLILDFRFEVKNHFKNAAKIVALFIGILVIVNLWKLFHSTLPMQLNSHQEGIFYISLMMIGLMVAGLFFLTEYLQKKDDKIYHQKFVELGRLKTT